MDTNFHIFPHSILFLKYHIQKHVKSCNKFIIHVFRNPSQCRVVQVMIMNFFLCTYTFFFCKCLHVILGLSLPAKMATCFIILVCCTLFISVCYMTEVEIKCPTKRICGSVWSPQEGDICPLNRCPNLGVCKDGQRCSPDCGQTHQPH